MNGEDVRLMLWDTAGQEEFDCITRAYYRGAQACVLAFSCVDRESFKQVGRWKRKVEEECGNIPMVMVMTKMDLLYKAAMDSFEVEKMSRNLGLPLIKTSVKENLNVSKVSSHLKDAGGDAGVAGVLPVGHPAPLLGLRVERGPANHTDRRGEVHHLQSGGLPHKVEILKGDVAIRFGQLFTHVALFEGRTGSMCALSDCPSGSDKLLNQSCCLSVHLCR